MTRPFAVPARTRVVCVSSVPPLLVVVGYWRFGAIPRAVPVVWNQYTFYSIGYTTTLVLLPHSILYILLFFERACSYQMFKNHMLSETDDWCAHRISRKDSRQHGAAKGVFATGAAANDPLFWPMHPIFDKMTQALRMAPALGAKVADRKSVV